MRGRRLFHLVVASALLVLSACAPADNGVEATPEPDDRGSTNAQQDECIEGTGDGPAIEWQNTVVDIEPTSQFGAGSDTAYVTTTVATSEDEADGVRRELELIEGATGEESEDGRLFTVVQQMDVEKNDEDEYRFSMHAPLDGTQLAKDGDISVVVQLPRSSEGKENVPAYEVELVSAGSEDESVPEPTIHDGEENPLIGERITVSWFWCVDPPLDLIYRELFG